MQHLTPSLIFLTLLATLLFAGPARAADKIRIACVGDSVTFGDGIRDRSQAYPGQLQKLLGDAYDVRNFGVNSTAVLKKADFSYFNNPAYKEALAFNPNIVILQFGGNDSKTQNWVHKDDFLPDYKELIASFRHLPAKPRILINTTSPAFAHKWNIADEVIRDQVIPLVRQTAFDEHLEIIDVYSAFLGKQALFPDQMHPNPEACAYIAKIIEGVLMFKDDPSFNIEKTLANKKTATKVSNFYGFRQLDFTLPNGSKATIVRPYRVAAGHQVAWRADQFGEQPQTDIGLLQRGYHLFFVDPVAWGKQWDGALGFLRDRGLGKITMIGMGTDSRAYGWAAWATHPDSMSVLYLDSTKFPSDKAIDPIDPSPLAKAGVAILLVVGQKDTEVPPAENADAFEKTYKALGGTIEVIRKPDAGHKPYSLPNPEPIVQFILDHNN